MMMRQLAVWTALLLFTATAEAQDDLGMGDPESGLGDDTSGDDMGGDDMGGDDMGGDDMGGDDMGSDTGAGDMGGGGPEKPISLGLLLGYGVSLEDGANPLGLGFGIRGGYNLDKIFLGARFVYYLGESENIPDTSLLGTSGEISFNMWDFGIEGGYDVDAGGLTVRPGLGLGIANLIVDFGGVSDSSGKVYLAPGVSLLADVSDAFFVGGDVRFQIIFADDTVKALTFLANAGMRF